MKVNAPSLQEIAMMEAISGPESAGQYNVINGGGKFDGYEDHPVSGMDLTGERKAAGRYQFMPGTWRELQSKYGFADFSPENQDAAMVAYMRETWIAYRGNDTRSMSQALADGDFNTVTAALSNRWTSLPGGSEDTKYDGDFRKFRGEYSEYVEGEKKPGAQSYKQGQWDMGWVGLDDKAKEQFKKDVPEYQKELAEINRKAVNGEINNDVRQKALEDLVDKYPNVARFPERADKVYRESLPEYQAAKEYEKAQSEWESSSKEYYQLQEQIDLMKSLPEEEQDQNKIKELEAKQFELTPTEKYNNYKKASKNLWVTATNNGASTERVAALKANYEKLEAIDNNDLVLIFGNTKDEDASRIKTPLEELSDGSYLPEKRDPDEFKDSKRATTNIKDAEKAKKNIEYRNALRKKLRAGESIVDIDNPEVKETITEVQEREIPGSRVFKDDPQWVKNRIRRNSGRSSKTGSYSESGRNKADAVIDAEREAEEIKDDSGEKRTTEDPATAEAQLNDLPTYKVKKQSFYERMGGGAALAGFTSLMGAVAEGDQDPGDIELPRVSEMVLNHANTLREIAQRGLNPVEEAKILNDINTAFQSAVSVVKEISGGQRGAALAGLSAANVQRNEGLKNKALLDIQTKRQALVDYGNILTSIDTRNMQMSSEEAKINYQMQKDRAIAQGEAMGTAIQTMNDAMLYAKETGPGSLYDIQRQMLLSKFKQVDEEMAETQKYIDLAAKYKTDPNAAKEDKPIDVVQETPEQKRQRLEAEYKEQKEKDLEFEGDYNPPVVKEGEPAMPEEEQPEPTNDTPILKTGPKTAEPESDMGDLEVTVKPKPKVNTTLDLPDPNPNQDEELRKKAAEEFSKAGDILIGMPGRTQAQEEFSKAGDILIGMPGRTQAQEKFGRAADMLTKL